MKTNLMNETLAFLFNKHLDYLITDKQHKDIISGVRKTSIKVLGVRKILKIHEVYAMY